MKRLSLFALAAVALALAVGAGCAGTAPRQQTGSAVVQVPLAWSSAYLVLGERPVLVDAGSDRDDDFDVLGDALAAHGLGWTDLALVVVTHGHADHAGGAARIARASGAPVVLGAADTALAAAGHSGPLPTMSVEARMIRPFVPKTFAPFTPDITLGDAPLDLRPFGVSGTVLPAPGHTDGSLVIRLAGGEAIVGDLFRGGILGGRLRAGTPHRHYFHADRARAEAAIVTLLDGGATRFYLGHGGPVSADAARARFTRPAATASVR